MTKHTFVANGHTYHYSTIRGHVYPPKDDIEKLFDHLEQNIELRNDDVFVTTYPKCGTTFMQQICLGLAHVKRGEAVSADAHYNDSPWPFTFKDPAVHQPEKGAWFYHTVETIKDIPSPRIFKSHATLEMQLGYDHETNRPTTPGVKVVYVSRNPKDALVSMYYHAKRIPVFGYDGPFDDWFGRWIEGKVEYGSWFDHNIAWFDAAQQHPEEILFITFEELVLDIEAGIRKVAAFMDIDGITDDQVAEVVKFSSFDSMKSKTEILRGQSGHFRKGKIGDWRTHFSPEQNEIMDKLYNKRLNGSGLFDVFNDYVHE